MVVVLGSEVGGFAVRVEGTFCATVVVGDRERHSEDAGQGVSLHHISICGNRPVCTQQASLESFLPFRGRRKFSSR